MAEFNELDGEIQGSAFVVFHAAEHKHDWIEKQTRIFGRWVSHRLQAHSVGGRTIHNLFQDVKDGLVLVYLLEVLSPAMYNSATLGRYHTTPKHAIQELENIQLALAALQRHNVKLVNIGATDIHEGKPVPVLGLVWTLILTYQLNVARPVKTDLLAKSTISPAQPVTNDLLKWVCAQISSYTHVTPPSDFTASWQDGKVLCALLDSINPEASLIDTHHLSSPLEDCALAIRRANEIYQIPALLDAQDMVREPDEHSNMTYIALYRECWERRSKEGSSPPAVVAETIEQSDNSFRRRLIKIFELYDPPQLENVESLLVEYDGRALELLRLLKTRYVPPRVEEAPEHEVVQQPESVPTVKPPSDVEQMDHLLSPAEQDEIETHELGQLIEEVEAENVESRDETDFPQVCLHVDSPKSDDCGSSERASWGDVEPMPPEPGDNPTIAAGNERSENALEDDLKHQHLSPTASQEVHCAWFECRAPVFRAGMEFCAVHMREFSGGKQAAAQCFLYTHPTIQGSTKVVTHFHFRVALLASKTLPMRKTVVEVRFSALFELHNRIKAEYVRKGLGVRDFPTFPDKKQRRTLFSNSKSFGFLDTRQSELHNWIRSMLCFPQMTASETFLEFFKFSGTDAQLAAKMHVH